MRKVWVGWMVLVKVEVCDLRVVVLEVGYIDVWVSVWCLVGEVSGWVVGFG